MRAIPRAVLFTLLLTPLSFAQHGKELSFRETLVAGTAQDFMQVRHLVLRGSNRAIGAKLAELARTRHGVLPRPSKSPYAQPHRGATSSATIPCCSNACAAWRTPTRWT